MASLLRQIVAGPRSRHPDAGLDLCYVTDRIIATSGPSGTYPQRAYRNPLDSLVRWLDSKHGDDWAIWEFRAEGTGYPDSEVYNRCWHYPFPDHHPPPFALIPNMMASMRNWLKEKESRVVVVHCKAGKGRSGTASCSYLISEEGWEMEKALKRFTERRMRPGMGKGVSIPSQLRWIGYVDRWAKHGKIYVERQVEVLEVHCWGLRDGVKIQIEGFVDEGKRIKTFHTFTRSERELVRGDIEPSGGLASVVSEFMGKHGFGSVQPPSKGESDLDVSTTDQSTDEGSLGSTTVSLGSRANTDGVAACNEESADLKTGDVVFRPSKSVILPTSDINVDVERRNKTAFELTYVTAIAHVWFNTFFEGNGPEQDGHADDSGVFQISWDAMDGIKGSSRKGIPAFDKIAVVWRTHQTDGKPGIIITEPREGEPVPQYAPADWTGNTAVEPSEGKDIGLRTSSPATSTVDLSRSSSTKSERNAKPIITAPDPPEDTTEGARSCGPQGNELLSPASSSGSASNSGVQSGIQHVSTGELPGGVPEHKM